VQNSGFVGSITSFGNGWYRCAVQFTGLSTSLAARIHPTNQNNTITSGDGTSGILIWGAQLERHTSARTYIPTTTAAVYNARFDHDPVTLACKGLLIEESRTNLTTQSGNASIWTSAPTTVTNNGSTTAPDGSSNGFLGGFGLSSLTTPVTPSVTGLHTASVFVKRNNTDWVRIQAAQGSFAHGVNFWVNLATGTAGTLAVAVGTPTSLSAQVTPFGNSWYRISITASYPATALITLAVISATADSNPTRVAGSVYEVWGGQIEAGSFPTSYIPTVASSVVRSQDVCSITGAAFTGFYNQSEGSFACNYSIPAGFTGNRYAAAIEDTPAGLLNAYTFRSTNAALNFINTAGYFSTIGAVTTTLDKHIIAYSGTSEFVYCKNGVIGSNTGSGTRDPSLLIRMGIGTLEGGNGFSLCGHIAAIRYFKKRLPNAKLQTITT